jgi:hypothetical protein
MIWRFVLSLLPSAITSAVGTLGFYVALGAGVAVLGSAVTYHLVTVHNAYERGASAAREQCSRDAAEVKQKAELAYQLRARRLEAQLRKERDVDAKAEEDANKATTGLEGALARMKINPTCWSSEVVREVQR